MAGLLAHAQTSAKLATSLAQKTLVQIEAPTNQRVKVHEWSISFDGVSNTDAPIYVMLIRQTTAGTMTGLTVQKNNPSDTETVQTTAQENATAEPATTTVMISEQVHPQGGYTWQAPFGREIIVPGGGRLGLVVLSTVNVNAVARIDFEE